VPGSATSAPFSLATSRRLRKVRHIRLDTLAPVQPSTLLWGAEGPAVKVRRFALHREQAPGRVAYLPISAQWAVRLVPDRPLDRRAARIAYLIARDGRACLYCGADIAPLDCSIEHLVPKSAGGPDHASNLALAHPSCNAAVGHMSAAEKLRFALARRIA
jgi:hypothetical protein